MPLFQILEDSGGESLTFVNDAASKLQALIAIHSTRRGPAFGGIRTLSYQSESAAMTDAVRLAQAMAYKAAVADLPAGGGKVVLIKTEGMDRTKAFRALGKAIHKFGGNYFTGLDVGTTREDLLEIAKETSYVAKDLDFGKATARGVVIVDVGQPLRGSADLRLYATGRALLAQRAGPIIRRFRHFHSRVRSNMAGHSKWANIQHRKNAQDAKRGKIFTKLIREISVAARLGGGDPASNPRLRTAMDKALAANMTRDSVERAVKKATGELEGVNYEEIRYEGYAPGGVAVIVDCLTDNHVRTVADVRHAFSKFGGNLGTDGSVAFMFRKLGVLSFAPGSDEDAITEAAIEAGADDIVTYPEDGSIDVLTDPDTFAEVRDAMVAAGVEPAQAEVTWRADNDVAVEGETGQQVVKLLDWLEDIDDVQAVYSNAELGEDAYA